MMDPAGTPKVDDHAVPRSAADAGPRPRRTSSFRSRSKVMVTNSRRRRIVLTMVLSASLAHLLRSFGVLPTSAVQHWSAPDVGLPPHIYGKLSYVSALILSREGCPAALRLHCETSKHHISPILSFSEPPVSSSATARVSLPRPQENPSLLLWPSSELSRPLRTVASTSSTLTPTPSAQRPPSLRGTRISYRRAFPSCVLRAANASWTLRRTEPPGSLPRSMICLIPS
jgi:hypothetical protein